mmetsp:Transcript_30223/g.22459  ORF Transcript_30223/g.22459 Transcript_30223/m.22459 type:complete len:168 (+) Transcript_30223:487-990(+)
MDSGHNFFVDYLFRQGQTNSAQEKFKVVAEEYIKDRKFISKLNNLITFCLHSFSSSCSEESLMEFVSSFAPFRLVDKAQRVTLWLSDPGNLELWTSFRGKRVAMDMGRDVAGECVAQRKVVVVTAVREHQLVGEKRNEEYERMFKDVDPYLYKDREFVVAFPLLNPF